MHRCEARTMITLGRVALRGDESSRLTRIKLLGLLRSLDESEILATQVATGVSEIARSYTQGGGHAWCELTLDPSDAGVCLQITLEGSGDPPDAGPLRLVTNDIRVHRADPHVITARLRLKTPPRLLTPGFIDRQRGRVQQRSRRELMDELREKNRQLEEYNEALEETVAERTSELRQANRKMRHDLEAAATYVRSIIPAPTKSPVSIDWRYIPSSALGGDTIGYHWLDDVRLALYLIDVTGHGLDSALHAVTMTNIVRSGSLPSVDMARPDQVVTALNNAFPASTHGNKFCTIWYGVYHLDTAVLEWAGGGHHPSLLFEPDSSAPTLLESSGPLLGALSDLDYPTLSIDVAPGSRLLIFSDGVFELLNNGKLVWTFHEMIDFVATLAGRDGTLADGLLNKARRILGDEDFDDDVSLIEVHTPNGSH
jgi:serine phosphatase RsbU (regulator of sigma subunit)